MHIVREIKIGDKLWLGDTQYEIIEQLRDAKRKVVAGTFTARPCAWSDLILNAPAAIREQAQKTAEITIVFPMIVWSEPEIKEDV